MDDKLTKDHVKEPIQDFVKLIKQEAELGAKPTNWVLNFRDWQINNQEKPVYKIKHEHLRFRKDNGRIASDVESYEMMEAPLQEESKFAQDKLREFLEEKTRPNQTIDEFTETLNAARTSNYYLRWFSGKRKQAETRTRKIVQRGEKR